MEASRYEVSRSEWAEFFAPHAQERITLGNVTLEQLKDRFTDLRTATLPISVDEYLGWLSREVLPYAVNVSSQKFIGHMTSALPDFMPELSALVSRLNQNMVKVETSKSLTLLERQMLAMLHREFFGGVERRDRIQSEPRIRSGGQRRQQRDLRPYGMPEIAHC